MTARVPFTAAIVNWNGGALVSRCLESLNRQTLPAFEVLVVDNGSTDDSRDRVAAFRPRAGIHLRLVTLDRNRGVAFGRQVAVEAATGLVIGFLDVDSEATTSWAAKALAVLDAHPDVGALASLVLFPDGRVNGLGAHLDRTGHGRDDGYGAARPAPAGATCDTGYPMGCGMVLRREVARRMEWDPLPVKWHDDSEAGLQVWALGFRVFAAPQAVVMHHQGQADRLLGRPLYYAERARLRMVWKYYPLASVAGVTVGMFASAVRSVRRPSVMVAYLCAVAWNLRHAPSALAIRRRWRPRVAPVLARVVRWEGSRR